MSLRNGINSADFDRWKQTDPEDREHDGEYDEDHEYDRERDRRMERGER